RLGRPAVRALLTPRAMRAGAVARVVPARGRRLSGGAATACGSWRWSRGQVGPRASRPVTRRADVLLSRDGFRARRAPGYPGGALRSLLSLRPIISREIIGRRALRRAGARACR